MRMKVLGIHSAGHDTGVALFAEGELVCAMESERITRRRHESEVDSALEYLSRYYPSLLSDVTVVASSTPVRSRVLKIDNLETQLRHLSSDQLHVVTRCDLLGRSLPCFVILHEACHATLAVSATKWRPETLVLVNEGRGLLSRNSMFYFDGDRISWLEKDMLPWYGTGFGWSALSYAYGLGTRPSGAGTMMAMAGHGGYSERVAEQIVSTPNSVMGLPRPDQERMLERFIRGTNFGVNFQDTANVVATFQSLFSREVEECIQRFLPKRLPRSIAVGGGCALNIATNSVLRKCFGDLGVSPACNDCGQAIGAGLYYLRFIADVRAPVAGIRKLGRGPRTAIEGAKSQNVAGMLTRFPARLVAERLARGSIVAWASGPSAVGPRSLGERSFLASPMVKGMKDAVSVGIKGRQWFRPLSPIMRLETFQRLFPYEYTSPHMLFQYLVPDCGFPEARHIDGTARLQTLDADDLPNLSAVLAEFELLTGVPALINTSLNRAGRAIALDERHVFDEISDLKEVDLVVVDNDVTLR